MIQLRISSSKNRMDLLKVESSIGCMSWRICRAVNTSVAECICYTLTEQPSSRSLASSPSQPHHFIKADTWQPTF